MPVAVMAVDIAVLVPEPAAARARDINVALASGRPDALRLDAGHLPHVTLAQQFVERSRFPELVDELGRILRHERSLMLRIPASSVDHGTIHLVVEPSPDLQRLHELIMDTIEPFESPEGAADAFRSNHEAIRRQDVDWVRNYRENAAYARYHPHVTVGHGARAVPIQPMEFRADRIGACELGRFCTCRTVLHAWTLGANHQP